MSDEILDRAAIQWRTPLHDDVSTWDTAASLDAAPNRDEEPAFELRRRIARDDPRSRSVLTIDLDDEDASGDIAPDLLRDVILPSQLLASADCLDVYLSMFALRLEEALEARFPAVRSIVGELAFGRLCRDHALACAAAHLGADEVEARFAGHIAASERLEPAHRGWLADLARLERAIELAGAAEETTTLTLAELVDVPRERWYCTHLVPSESVQLLALEHQVDGAYDAWLDGDLPGEPLRHAQWLVVHGTGDGRIERVSLPRRAFLLLSALCVGRSLRDAIDAALGAHARPETQHRLFQWLCSWVAGGMFRALETR